jgi:hypothetical protein
MMMMKDSQTPFCCSEFPWARERISPKIPTVWARVLNNFASRVLDYLRGSVRSGLPTEVYLYVITEIPLT